MMGEDMTNQLVYVRTRMCTVARTETVGAGDNCTIEFNNCGQVVGVEIRYPQTILVSVTDIVEDT